MHSIEFGKKCQQLNSKYKELFGYIPCPDDYIGNQDEFFDALKKSIETNCEIHVYLKKRNRDYSNPNILY